MDPQRLEEFAAGGYNRVPVYREVLADLDTPLSTYLKLAEGSYSYLFESVHGGEKWGRYSIIGLPATGRLEVRGRHIEVFDGDTVVERADAEDPLAWIAAFEARFKVPRIPELPRFTGGLVGYFSYDTVRYIEPRLGPCMAPDPLGVPDILLTISEEVVVFDNLKGTLYLLVHVDPAAPDALGRAEARLDALEERLRNAPLPAREPATPGAPGVTETDFVSGFTRAGFEAAVERAKEYIVEGDIMQVVLSQRLTTPFAPPPLDLYRALRSLNPSPYLFFLDLGGFQIAGSSPEILVRVEEGRITVRPIAGTRPRGADEAADRALEADLLADPKELAEHLMLIDLGRNDVGRVAETGTVELTERMAVERYSHVMHIVSNVTGRLKAGLGPVDALRATFPAGTLSGAAKVRAMEIIDELEPVKRGVYGGAVGYVSWQGDMDTAIAIRTAVIKDGELHIQAGAGIVADSVPATEWEETMNKGRAIFRAVAMAHQGLRPLSRDESA